MKKLWKVLGVLILTPIIIGMVAYLYMADRYNERFMSAYIVNSVFAYDKTVAEMNEELVERTEAPEFTITDIHGDTYDVPITELDFTYTYEEDLKQLKAKENPLLWGLTAIEGRSESYEFKPKGSCDTEALNDYLMGCELIANQADAKRLKVQIKRTKDGYYLLDQTKDLLNVEKTVKAIEAAVLDGAPGLDLVKAGCYEAIEYTRSNEKVLKTYDEIAKLQDTTLTIEFYKGNEVIDAALISGWIATDPDTGKFLYDDFGHLYLDEEKVTNYVDKLAEKYDNAKGPWTVHPTRGGTVTIEKGTFGYLLNREEMVKFIMGKVNAHRSGEFEAIYKQKAIANSNGGIGNTYIEVDMTAQTLYYYEDGSLYLKTPVVTGNVNAGNGTPERVCYIYYKQRNRTLVGENNSYHTFVNYWMAVNGNIGIHDANWRSKFGGTIYRGGGSHGCVNTPIDKVKILYERCPVGTPVIMFY
ncbi:MAG: L,D-transpeptidase/peptidoglycan binding protein [Acetatifactor sp.]|nr:L,D-transpeptidase/peptidoglycan binding protein [Acetatifactor sp.]